MLILRPESDRMSELVSSSYAVDVYVQCTCIFNHIYWSIGGLGPGGLGFESGCP